jgi:uncharacterized protein (UPF0332 family)
MEDRARRDLSVYRLSEARRLRKVAIDLIGLGEFKDANNRAYYSSFNAIKSVYAINGVDYKRHKEVLAKFNENYINNESENCFPKEMGRRLKKIELIRHASDYKEFYIATKEEALEQIETAKIIIEGAEKYLARKLGQEQELEEELDYDE